MFVHLVDFLKESTLCFIECLYCLFVSILLISALSLFAAIYSSWLSLLLFVLELAGVLLSHWYEISPNILCCHLVTLNFHHSTAFIVSHEFEYAVYSLFLNSRMFYLFLPCPSGNSIESHSVPMSLQVFCRRVVQF